MTSDKIRKLIPELDAMQKLNPHAITPNDVLGCMGSFGMAISYMTLFWPSLLEYDGCVFVGDSVDKANYQDWLKSLKGDKGAVERVLKHVHITDLFPQDKDSPTKEQVVFIGKRLTQMWQAKAQQDFPSKTIKVVFYESDNYELDEFQVTLFQEGINRQLLDSISMNCAKD